MRQRVNSDATTNRTLSPLKSTLTLSQRRKSSDAASEESVKSKVSIQLKLCKTLSSRAPIISKICLKLQDFINTKVYKINLGTEFGQKVYTALMIVLPMIPLLILIIRIGNDNWYNSVNELELERYICRISLQYYYTKNINRYHFYCSRIQ